MVTALLETIVLLMRAGFGLWTGVKFTRINGCFLSKLRTFFVPNQVSGFNFLASDLQHPMAQAMLKSRP